MYKEYETIYLDMAYHINNRDRSLVEHRYIKASTKRGGIIYDALPMESDNRADTLCVGANFQPIIYNRKNVLYSPFYLNNLNKLMSL